MTAKDFREKKLKEYRSQTKGAYHITGELLDILLEDFTREKCKEQRVACAKSFEDKAYEPEWAMKETVLETVLVI